MASATTSRACVPWPSSASWCSTPASPPTRAGSSPSTSSSCSPASSSPPSCCARSSEDRDHRPRRLLRPPGATDPAGRHRRDHRHRRRVVAVAEPARRAGRLRRRRVGGALRGQHPLRRRGDRLLHRDRPAVAAPALLVAVGGGAVLPRHAARAPRVDRGGRPRAAAPRRARPPGRAIVTVLALATAASLAWSVHASPASPESAYFSTFTRVWEFGAGGLLAVFAPRLARDLGQWRATSSRSAGLGLIGVALFVVTERRRSPAGSRCCRSSGPAR